MYGEGNPQFEMMNRPFLSIGLLGSVWLMAVFSLATQAAEPANAVRPTEAAQTETPATAAPAQEGIPIDKTKVTDKEHMLAIWKALMAYQKAKGKLPDYLSDLVPEYLPDKSVLVSPVQDDNRQGGMDPKIASSYSYEFCADEFAGQGRTFREVKEAQMKEFGPVIPILRCFAHGERVLNVAYSGDYFESQLYWESSPEARELTKKLGVGPGFDEGEFTEVQVVDARTNEPLAGAEVRLTQRQYHFLPLPDRTLKTDDDGRVRVPLGPSQPPSRQLTVTASKPGFFAPSEIWMEGVLPVEKTFRMVPAQSIGGVVQNREGAPLAGAKVNIFVAARSLTSPDAPDQPPGAPPNDASAGLMHQAVDSAVTDAAGRWRCESVPKDMEVVDIFVQHPAAWATSFVSTGQGAEMPHSKAVKLDLEALKAGRAELRLEPPVMISGVLRGPDGVPLAGEEITVGPHASEDVIPQTPGGMAMVQVETDPDVEPKKLKTDEKGHFSLAWTQSQDLMLSATPRKFAAVMRMVSVAQGLEPVEMKASLRRRITARVRDGDGKPAAGVQVMFIGWVDAPVDQPIGTTDEKGEFVWDAAPSDQVGLTFAGGGFSPSTEWVPIEKKDAVVVELRRLEEPRN